MLDFLINTNYNNDKEKIMFISKINKTYKSEARFRASIMAINNLTLDLPPKGLIFILGKSGCGKTTLLNLLGGLDKPDSGGIIIEGKDIGSAQNFELNYYRNSYCGFIFQEYNLLGNFDFCVLNFSSSQKFFFSLIVSDIIFPSDNSIILSPKHSAKSLS